MVQIGVKAVKKGELKNIEQMCSSIYLTDKYFNFKYLFPSLQTLHICDHCKHSKLVQMSVFQTFPQNTEEKYNVFLLKC